MFVARKWDKSSLYVLVTSFMILSVALFKIVDKDDSNENLEIYDDMHNKCTCQSCGIESCDIVYNIGNDNTHSQLFFFGVDLNSEEVAKDFVNSISCLRPLNFVVIVDILFRGGCCYKCKILLTRR